MTLENVTRDNEAQRVRSDRLIISEWPLRLQRRGPLHVVLPTDGALWPWWQSKPSPGTEQACRVTTGHARANYPSETWRESLSCVAHPHTLRAQINPAPPRLWWRRLFNESREVFKASCDSHSPSSISFKSKIFTFNQWQKLIWIDPSDFGADFAIVQIQTFWCADTFHHLICMPAMRMFVWFDICKWTAAINAVAGDATCSDSAK